MTNSTEERCNQEPPSLREAISRLKSRQSSWLVFGLVLTVLLPMWLFLASLAFFLRLLTPSAKPAEAQDSDQSAETGIGVLKDAYTEANRKMGDKAAEEDLNKLELMMDDLDGANERVQAMYFPFAMLKLIALVGEEEAHKLLDSAVQFFEGTEPELLRRHAQENGVGDDGVDQEWPEEIG